MRSYLVFVSLFGGFAASSAACSSSVGVPSDDDAGASASGGDAGDAKLDGAPKGPATTGGPQASKPDGAPNAPGCTCRGPQPSNPAECPKVVNATVLPGDPCPTLGLVCEYADDSLCGCGDRTTCVAGDGGALAWSSITRVD